MRATLQTLSRKSDTAAAILLWLALLRYFDDGAIEIDNSAAERAATIYSLIGTAKLNGVDPEALLSHVQAHIADHPVNRVDDFLPGTAPPRSLLPEKHTASQRCDAIIKQFHTTLKTALTTRLLSSVLGIWGHLHWQCANPFAQTDRLRYLQQ